MSDSNSRLDVNIRLATSQDATSLAILCQQLLYQVSLAQVQLNLTQIRPNKEHAVYVAELQDKQVVGWIHICLSRLLFTNQQAEIGGLVVDERYRHCGIGRLLIQQAETWATNQGCLAVVVGSNIIRKEAHIFYENMGYNTFKTQLIFRKTLSKES